MIRVIKKDNTKEEFNVQKVVNAVNKSATRVMYEFTPTEIEYICSYVTEGRGVPHGRNHHRPDAQHS
jgi:transcriptional regulator NrdR family protein